MKTQMNMNSTIELRDSAAIANLRRNLKGPVSLPGDADYERGRRVWNGRVDKRPAVIVRCRSDEDVAEAVNFAREHDLEVSIRGGGHNVAGLAVTEGGLMIDLSQPTGIEGDAERSRRL